MNLEIYSLSKKIFQSICNKKVLKVDLLDVSQITSLADVFIIAVASNTKQTKAMADEVEEKLKDEDVLPIRKEGYDSANWILIDYGYVIVHILDEEYANFYGLTRLWQDAKSIDHY